MTPGFCESCGASFGKALPARCEQCGHMRWLNPDPVVVLIQPVVVHPEGGHMMVGALSLKRAIEPEKGKWALLSGFMNVGETAEDAVRREFSEETGLTLDGPLRYWHSRPNERNELMLFFSAGEPMSEEKIKRIRLCEENEAFGVVVGVEDMAFPTHTEFLEIWNRR